jgi:hypothetical protein
VTRRTATAVVLAACLSIGGLAVPACNKAGPYRAACTDLCTTLAGDCELPGYEGAAACIPSCEEEMADADQPEELLDCYGDADCSVEALIACKRLDDAGRL